MNILIRIAQILLALAALDGAFGLTLRLGLSATFGSNLPTALDIMGTIVSIAVYGLAIYLLQRYYNHRNGRLTTAGEDRRFAGIALTSVGIAAATGFAVVALIIVLALALL